MILNNSLNRDVETLIFSFLRLVNKSWNKFFSKIKTNLFPDEVISRGEISILEYIYKFGKTKSV